MAPSDSDPHRVEGPANGNANQAAHTPKAGFWSLTLGSVGVVYGDIGTSPLYAFREALSAAVGDGAVHRETVLGVISLIIWALLLIVTIKYVLILLRADNNGEGGTLSLLTKAQRAIGRPSAIVFGLGMLGAALFYGDSIITPAISVLSAVEGLEVAAPAFSPYVLPTTILILVVLFAVQSRGTASVAFFFGPITALWFLVLAVTGAIHIFDDPTVLYAINPYYAAKFLAMNQLIGLIALGAVFLAVTGAEALYTDLGHFGRRPIQFAWLALVLPALALNYLGQGALVLRDPTALENPFFRLAPDWALFPLIAIATVATIIASQAVITGAFSITRQAVQLGLLPRLEIRHTSESQAGQIYLPQVNSFLMFGVVFLVLVFQSSSNLASAYGIAVTATMIIDSILAFLVIWLAWKWSPWAALAMLGPLALIELVFLGANLLKVVDGGWFPLSLASFLILIMVTWRTGTRYLFEKTRKAEVPLADLIKSLEDRPPARVPGTAIFLTSDPESAPTALLHSLKHYKVLHERNVILTVRTTDEPRVPEGERLTLEPISDSFTRIEARFGYMETPHVPKALVAARKVGWKFDIMTTSFFLSRRSLKASPRSGMPVWQDNLFITLARNADDASNYFHIPTNRVVEIGTQVMI